MKNVLVLSILLVLCVQPLPADLLHDASYYGLLSEVKRLVAMGANVNARDPFTASTPLHAAIEGAHFEVVQFLLNSGAKTYIRECSTKEGFHYTDRAVLAFAIRELNRYNPMNISPTEATNRANLERIVQLLKKQGAITAGIQ